MATICERCKELEKKKYWEKCNKQQFFKVLMNDFQRRLRIPHKFVTNLKDSHKLLGQKILKGPSGNSWKVEVKRTEDDDYVFCNGWELFVKDHNLEAEDLLVFRMDGFSSFNVMIFDLTACEKEDTFFVKKQRNPCKHQAEVIDDGTSEQESSENDEHSNDSNEQQSYGKHYSFHLPEPRKGKKLKKILIAKQEKRKRKCTPLSSSCKKKMKSEEKRHMFSNRRLVTQKERIKVLQMASKHISFVPSFLVTMQPTHVDRGQLKLPKGFAEKYTKNQSETINLTTPSSGRTWEVSVRRRQEGLVMQTGWEDFVMDNNLEEYDICVFELAQGGKHNSKPVVLDVYIFRAVDEIMRQSSSNSTSIVD